MKNEIKSEIIVRKKCSQTWAKVQINSERNVTLAIRITENHVHNLIFNLETFVHIMSRDVQNWYGLIHGRYWQLQKLSDRVKLFDENTNIIIGFQLKSGEVLKKQFAEVLNDKRTQ